MRKPPSPPAPWNRLLRALAVCAAGAIVGCATAGSQAQLDDTTGDASADQSADQSADAPVDVASDAADASDADVSVDGEGDADADAGDEADAELDAEAEADAPAGCTKDDDCTGSPDGAFCALGDAGVGACVACVPTNDTCSPGEYCGASLKCESGCKADADCQAADAGAGDGGATLHCDVAAHRCVGCLQDADCPPGALCDGASSACVPGCTPQHACAGTKDCCSGTCADTQTDLANCGACAASCAAVPHGTPVCAAGKCGLKSCDLGWGDCDPAVAGCETDLTTSGTSCGQCGVPCAPPNATGACVAGKCTVVTCAANRQDCDQDPANGCEVDVTSDPLHCGTCAVACNPTHGTGACSGGTCVVDQCASGWGDCDHAFTNGCETDLLTSQTSCGQCGTPCSIANGAGACVGGQCTVSSCNNGWGDCDVSATDGCETNILVNPAHCGKSCAPCSFTNAGALCVSGSCALGACQFGWGDCNHVASDGCEKGLLNDTNNCGSCGNACSLPHATSDCNSGQCSVVACVAGYYDCNSLAYDGCETHTDVDLKNCGGCGNVCLTPNATAKCVSGSCGVQSCSNGWLDCDKDPSNGCEINGQGDTSNCGVCGKICTIANGVPACTSGQCAVSACTGTWKDCDGSALNGCEVDTSVSVANCGACSTDQQSHACSFANADAACSGSSCLLAACHPGWADCDGQWSNGCETPTNTAANCGGCGVTCQPANATATCATGTCLLTGCASGYDDCNNRVTDGCETDLTSPFNCGSCGSLCVVANGSPTCGGGVCAVGSCLAGFADCNGSATDGCETNLQLDPVHCGTCATQCVQEPNAVAPTCTGGSCAVGTCAAGYTDCNKTLSDGCEVHTSADTANCGGCGKACSLPNVQGYTCTGGTCGVATNGCQAGYADCNGDPTDGCEIYVLGNVDNCGTTAAACGNKCAVSGSGTPQCVLGTCSAKCSDPYADCNGSPLDGCETNIVSGDPANCGACGQVCSLPHTNKYTCNSKQCGVAIGGCATGYADCDGIASNGCEVDLKNDPSNCNACSSKCNEANATAGCSNGACTVDKCGTGYADCDKLAANGCEVNTQNGNVLNCGGCGLACNLANATPACSGGSCTIAACDTGFADCDGLPGDGCEVNYLSNALSCGTCGTVCNLPNVSTNGCTNGKCSVTACTPGFADCDGDPNNGCEVSYLTDVNNCSTSAATACGHACTIANGQGTCSSGTCQVSSCTAPWANCDGDVTNGCETNTSSSHDNCGGCAVKCSSTNASESCKSSVCHVDACVGEWGDCDGKPENGCETALGTTTRCQTCTNDCSAAGTEPAHTNATCSVSPYNIPSGNACVYTCATNYYNMDASADCECLADQIATSCNAATPMVAASGGAVASGNLASTLSGGKATRQAWWSVTLPNVAACGWHPMLSLDTASINNGVRFDVWSGCSSGALTTFGGHDGSGNSTTVSYCNGSGDTSSAAGLSVFEAQVSCGSGIEANDGHGSFRGVFDDYPNSAYPSGGGSVTYYVRVYAANATANCGTYKITATY